MEYYQEENNYPKAFLATGIIMAVLIALCYFIVFHNPPPEQEDGTGGILVNYGTTDEGMGIRLYERGRTIKSRTAESYQADQSNPGQPTPQKTRWIKAIKK